MNKFDLVVIGMWVCLPLIALTHLDTFILGFNNFQTYIWLCFFETLSFTLGFIFGSLRNADKKKQKRS